MIKRDNKKYNILVAEDNQGDSFLIREYLEEAIYSPEITLVNSFAELEQQLKQTKDSFFDVILLDLTLPDKSGLELLEETKKLSSDTPIIVLTGYVNLDFAVNSLSLGVSDYLLKDELNATILYKSIIYNIERNKNLLKLKESEQKYSNLFQLSPTPTIVFEIDTFKCIKSNTAAENLYGFNCDDFYTISLLELFETLDFKEYFQNVIVEPSSGNTYLGKFRQVKKDGSFFISDCYYTPVQYNKHRHGLIIIVDITEKEMLENKISKAIIQALENEHYEIGAELHDNVCQTLVASQMNIGILKPIEGSKEVLHKKNAIDYINLALKDLQNISHRIAPAYLENRSLEESFNNLIKTFNVDDTLEINVEADEWVKPLKLSKNMHLNLYRVLQEQIRNILKHAKASRVDIVLQYENSILLMKVKDNGIGFDIDAQKKGIGFMNMKRRVELLSGKFEVKTSPGNGCQISIKVPVSVNVNNPVNYI